VERVDEVAILRPSLEQRARDRADSRNWRTLSAALHALPPTSPSGSCTPYVDMWVPRAFSFDTLSFRDGTRLLVAEARAGAGRDRDAVRLVCLPPAP